MSPARKPFLSAFAEDIGIEPNTRRYISLSRRTLSPSRFIFHSRHSRNRTYMEPINLSTAYQAEGICAVFFCGGRGGTRTPKAFATDLQSAEPTNCSTLPCCIPDRVRTCDPLIKSEVL